MKPRLPGRRRPLSITELVDSFDGHLGRKGCAPSTRVKYRQWVEHFASVHGSKAPGSLTAADIEQYLTTWETAFEAKHGRPPSGSTGRAHQTALRCFYRYLDQMDLLVDQRGRVARNPLAGIDLPRRQQRPIEYLRPEEDRALLEARGTPAEEYVVWLLRFSGIRIGEARALRIRDVDLTLGQERLIIRESKTAAGLREVPMLPELVVKTKAWLEHLQTAGLHHIDGPLLPTRNLTPMFATQIGRMIKRLAHRAGVQPVPCTCGGELTEFHSRDCPRTANGEKRSKVTAHTLRRTFATDALNREVSMEVVSSLLGHTSTQVTQQAYASLLPATSRNAFFRGYGHKVAA